jgi:hypothetical protein
MANAPFLVSNVLAERAAIELSLTVLPVVFAPVAAVRFAILQTSVFPTLLLKPTFAVALTLTLLGEQVAIARSLLPLAHLASVAHPLGAFATIPCASQGVRRQRNAVMLACSVSLLEECANRATRRFQTHA